MIVTLIVSVGQQLQLGKDNALLWKLKDDLLHFKRTTKGTPSRLYSIRPDLESNCGGS